jgi:hypothetical protein
MPIKSSYSKHAPEASGVAVIMMAVQPLRGSGSTEGRSQYLVLTNANFMLTTSDLVNVDSIAVIFSSRWLKKCIPLGNSVEETPVSRSSFEE